MTWDGNNIVVYHGTDNLSANAIRLYKIDPKKFRPKTDFGAGFYVTTVRHQAEQWANQRCRRIGRSAEILEYTIDRKIIESLSHLAFVVDTNDYYDFVAYCRAGQSNHGPSRSQPYDIVYGPVSLGKQKLVIASCDQILFSDPLSLAGFSYPSDSHSPLGRSRFF